MFCMHTSVHEIQACTCFSGAVLKRPCSQPLPARQLGFERRVAQAGAKDGGRFREMIRPRWPSADMHRRWLKLST